MTKPPSPIVINLAQHSRGLAQRLAKGLGGEWHQYVKEGGKGGGNSTSAADKIFHDTLAHIRHAFSASRPLIGICAPAILIRAIAPMLASGQSDKYSDPPVLAVAVDGKYVIPLLSAHHGGNALATRCAEICGGEVALATASDIRLGVGLDDPPLPFVLADAGQAKLVMAGLNDGAKLRAVSDLPSRLAHITKAWHDWLQPLLAKQGTAHDGDDAPIELRLTLHPISANTKRMVFHPRIAALGVGASRHCPPRAMMALLEDGLARHNLSRHVIAGVYSIDKKINEGAILDLANSLGIAPRFFTADRLLAETPRLASPPSSAVYAATGAYGVAEAAALAAAGSDGWLFMPKQKNATATIALAIAPSGTQHQDSRRRGRLSVIGMGPGGADWRTPQTITMLREADEIVGYRLYLELLGSVISDKPHAAFALGEEVSRCRYAIKKAREGKTIALVSSGDAGVYGMASLVYELLAAEANEFEIDASPGIPAHIIASSASGAILGHDHAIISLSDLLTPWEVIVKRIEAAAQADFVIAFYNPVSAKRKTALAKARKILLGHRPETTPVVLARNMGREGQTIRHSTRATLKVSEVDMLTLVLVGSRQSRQVQLGEAKRVYTPRGYTPSKPNKPKKPNKESKA